MFDFESLGYIGKWRNENVPSPWAKWFAWRPVKVDGDWVWWDEVYRRCRYKWHGFDRLTIWEYTFIRPEDHSEEEKERMSRYAMGSKRSNR